MHEMQRHSLHFRTRPGGQDHRAALKQKKYAHQRSILKNSQEYNAEEQEILEAKKQLILRRRRLFSHYRQYEQWRRRQFSYDPCYFRANPLPIGQAACGDYYSNFNTATGAFRRRRQYRRQYSCADRSREGSHESRESALAASMSLQKCHTIVASDTLNTDSSLRNRNYNAVSSPKYQYEHVSFDSSELHRYNSRHFHMLHEERSTSISERCTRSRINSAIFVSSEGRGFDSIEFLRRHGSQSVLCRKARSAENITDNDRKKSFSEQRQWRTDEKSQRRESNSVQRNAGDIELKECRTGAEARIVPVLNSNAEQITTVTTAANLIVGSISIEAPPSNIFDDTNSVKSVKVPTAHASISSTNSASHDSADTVEELIQIPTTSTQMANINITTTTTTTTSAVVTTAPLSSSPIAGPVTVSIPSLSPSSSLSSDRKSRVLVRQRSSTASPIGLRSQSPANAKPLTLKSVKPKVISNLPMVSVSGPSPQEEKPECL